MAVIQQLLASYGAIAIPPGTYATWNPSDKGGGVTLSNGNLWANKTSGLTFESVRATVAVSTKAYWEVTVAWATTGELGATGIATSSLVLSSTIQYVGQASTNCGVWGERNKVYKSGASIFDATDGSATYRLAFDPATGKLWIGTVAGGWYNGGDPAAGTNPVTTMAAGTYYPACTGSSSDVFKANFGASAFSGSVPSGFASGVFA